MRFGVIAAYSDSGKSYLGMITNNAVRVYLIDMRQIVTTAPHDKRIYGNSVILQLIC